MRTALLSLACCALGSAVIEEYKLSNEECLEAGFIPDSLKCTLCRELRNYNLEILMSDCMACCTVDEEDKHPTYPYAVIEVCECNLARFPQVQAFVTEGMAAKWGDKVMIRQVRGVIPRIVLKDDMGVAKETMQIEKWDTDTITEFLDEWIE